MSHLYLRAISQGDSGFLQHPKRLPLDVNMSVKEWFVPVIDTPPSFSVKSDVALSLSLAKEGDAVAL